ncbi:hypothetical protein EDC56_1433 [Sinobacterium caligoides]|uniref:Uncharacterized protein n=1 Tax=Sinobacterium caligoides TaxID=933926 RepID=A0A3N2DMJ6_9GAMM|nr:hypothetical protein EDC56_1433 [Sinobacterium caligoides]
MPAIVEPAKLTAAANKDFFKHILLLLIMSIPSCNSDFILLLNLRDNGDANHLVESSINPQIHREIVIKNSADKGKYNIIFLFIINIYKLTLTTTLC